MSLTYEQFIQQKTQLGGNHGFDPVWMPDFLYDFQKSLVEWSLRKGRTAILADCGLGKTAMQLVWAQNVVRKTNGRVLILTPLAVAHQTVKEAAKFGIEAGQSKTGNTPAAITVTNYQQLAKFNKHQFQGVVCDESGILKSLDGSTRAAITDFMRGIKYRLLCSATPAPNDYVELGNSSEALGYLRRVEMMAQYFNHDGGETSKWRLKGHAGKHLFWQWVSSWARAIRCPSDLGFDGSKFILPPLNIAEMSVESAAPRNGMLFNLPAVGLAEQREERRSTINARCEMAADRICGTGKPAVAWCHLNPEGDLLEHLIPDAVQVSGADSDDAKEEAFRAFEEGQIRVLVSKPVIAGHGLNWQHCAHQTFFPSHSFEQWYQAIRRCWRFGQKSPVQIDVITSAGESGVVENMKRKSRQAEEMFSALVASLNNEIRHSTRINQTSNQNTPSWL